MKKCILMMILFTALAAGVYAEEWYDSYAPGIRDNLLFINGGIGLGPAGGYSRGIPPISASVDVKLPIDMPVTLGAIVIYSTYRTSYPYYNPIYDVTYTNLGFGARGMWHFNFLENLDTYAGLTMGWVVQNSSRNEYPAQSFFLIGVNIGARYFFTNNIGAFLELGYSGLQWGSLGVTFKF